LRQVSCFTQRPYALAECLAEVVHAANRVGRGERRT
jgi:hypothetical protein